MRPVRSLRSFAILIGITGLITFGLSISPLLEDFPHSIVPFEAVPLILLYLISASWVVRGLQGGAVLTSSTALLFSLLIVLGPAVAQVCAAAHALYRDLWVKRIRDERITVNLGVVLISLSAAGAVYQALGGRVGWTDTSTLTSLSWRLPVQLLCAHLTYLLLSTGLISIGFSLRDRQSAWTYWRINCAPMFVKSFAAPVTGFLYARLYLANDFTAVCLLFALMLMDYFDYRAKLAIIRSRNRAVDTLLAISGVSKPYSQEEAAERTVLAEAMGKHLGLSQARMEVLHDAVLLHNIGYVGVDPSLLRRKGTLTDEEFLKIREHPRIGARILLRVPSLREVGWVVLCHHERPDGQGYPLRLNRGEAPVEAYVVAAVEGFCSLKYGRDHQKSLGGEPAFERLVALAGTRYDRAAVAALGRALGLKVPPHLEPYLHSRPSRGDLFLKKHHVQSLQPELPGFQAENLRLYSSFSTFQSGQGILATLGGVVGKHLTGHDLLRGRVFAVALSLVTLGLLLQSQEMAAIPWIAGAAQLAFWIAATGFASLLIIRLPEGASVTAASSMALAGAFAKGPLIGVLLGVMAGVVTHALREQERRSSARSSKVRLAFDDERTSPFVYPVCYGLGAGVAGLLAMACGGLPRIGHVGTPTFLLQTLGALGGVLLFSLIETVTMSVWAESVSRMSARQFRTAVAQGSQGFTIPADLVPPPPSPLSPWERWRANYRALFPEPLAYPAAGLLMALAYHAIGPWAVGVVLVYPVLWSHFRLAERLRLADCRLRLLLSISQSIDERHHYTQGHSIRVGLWAGAIAREMGYPEETAQELRLAGVLHDLGKASWTDTMLEKPKKLTPLENRLKEEHPVLSALVARASFPRVEMDILQHHEDWDGEGYPHRVPGSRIVPGARVLRVADTMDAIASGRPYKVREGKKDPLGEIRRFAFADFDPAAVAALGMVIEKKRAAFFQSASERPSRILLQWMRSLARQATEKPRPIAVTVSAGDPRHCPRFDAAARDHVERVGTSADYMARALNLPRREREVLRLATQFHAETCSLWPDPWRREGGRLTLADLRKLLGDPRRAASRLGTIGIERQVRNVLLHTGERWDGRGFPRGIRGEEIPMGARILSMACALDRLTIPLPHRRAYSPGAAMAELIARAGTVFDPRLTSLLSQVPAGPGVFCFHQASADELCPPLPPPAPPATRSAEDRLKRHCQHLANRAAALGVPHDIARILGLRHETLDGRGPYELIGATLPAFLARFQTEVLFAEMLQHEPRPLDDRGIARALQRMDSYQGWAAPAEAIERLRADVYTLGLPRVVEFLEWDRHTGRVETDGDRAGDEANLIAFALWADGIERVDVTPEVAAALERVTPVPEPSTQAELDAVLEFTGTFAPPALRPLTP